MTIKEVSKNHREEIITFISVHEVGRHLNIDGELIGDLNYDHNLEKDKRARLVDEWHKKNASDATYYAMITAMVKGKRIDHAERVCKLLANQGN